MASIWPFRIFFHCHRKPSEISSLSKYGGREMQINKLVFTILLLLPFHIFGTDSENLEKQRMETYYKRPDILSLKPEAMSQGALNNITQWKNMRKGHIEAIAFLLSMYPGHDIFFLARDAEYLYDAARVLTRRDSKAARRIHLLNVSTSAQRGQNIDEYLKQNNLSPHRKGYPVVFVDSGFSGSIANTIKAKMKKMAKVVSVHLLKSSANQYPSLTLFSGQNTDNLGGSYESIPHHTTSSIQYKKIGKKYYPTVSEGGNPEKAIEIMKDLYHFTIQPVNVRHYEKRRKMWKTIFELSEREDTGKLKNYIKKVLLEEKTPILREKIIDDLSNFLETNGKSHTRVKKGQGGSGEVIKVQNLLCQVYLEAG